MTHTNCINNLLEIKDVNINLLENSYREEKINNITTKIINGILSYTPIKCPCCKNINHSSKDIIKHGFKKNCKIILPKVSSFNTILFLDKQRYFCKNCNSTFTADTSLVDKYRNISNNTLLSIRLDLMSKSSEKDIAKRHNVSHNTINRFIDFLSMKTVLPGCLPSSINIDEFMATKDTKGKMAFHIVNNTTGKTFDILDSRKSNDLYKYFMRFPRKQRLNVKFIIVDMYNPYYKLFKVIFPKATIITDKFHVVALASNSLKMTRIKVMKRNVKYYNKLKHYWKLIQKFEDDLDSNKKHYSNHFKKYITEYEIVQFLINTDKELLATYNVYQGILRSIRNKDISLFIKIISSKHNNISDYMNTTLNTFNKFKISIVNSFIYQLNNGVIEGINNLIKCIKRIAFGYRSFYHFKTRIMLIAGIKITA